ncbi:MAG: ATP-binding protein, partial [Nannocystaceae bacterium]
MGGRARRIEAVDPARLDELLQLEDGRVDWKAGGDPEKVVRTLAAFANDFEGLGGGYVLCGVEEREGGDGAFPRAKLIGLDYDELRRVQNRVLSLCKKSLQPPISPSVDFVTLPGDRRLLVFFVAPSPGMVGLVKQGSVQTWIRIGDRVVQATADALERLLTTKGRWPPFLDRVCTEASRVDIDEAAVIAALGERGLPLQPLEYLMADQPLKGTAMPLFAKVRGPAAVEERPRYLALLLFGREPVRFIRGAHIQLSVYPGTTRDGSGERYEL